MRTSKDRSSAFTGLSGNAEHGTATPCWPSIRRWFIAAGSDVAVHSGFAVAEDRTGGVSCRGANGVIEPNAVAGGDKHLGVNTSERLGESVFDLSLCCVSHRLAYLSRCRQWIR